MLQIHWGYMLKQKNKIGGQGRGLNLACKSTPVSFCLAVIFSLCFSLTSHASSYDIPSEKIVQAIYHAEGGSSTRYPFGIKSIPCKGYDSCRLICLNSVKNAKKRYVKAGCPGDFISFMGKRYSPPEINPNWVRLVKYFINKEDKIETCGGF